MYSIKQFLYESFHRPRRFVANVFDTPAIILLYHRVTNLQLDPQQLSVSPENFYSQVEHIKKTYTLLRVDEFAHILNTKQRFPKRCVLLTFDDGYKDNHEEARPILEALGVQSLFFITTSLLGTTRELWWDELERILLLQKNVPAEFSFNAKGIGYRFSTATDEERRSTYHALHPIVKYLHPDERMRLFNEIYASAQCEPEGRVTHRLMSREELRRFSQSKSVVIGAHTHTHTPLSRLSFEEQKTDIMTSHAVLTEIVQQPVKYFSYPFGLKKDYNEDTIRILKELKYEMVCANYEDQVHRWTSRYELPRYLIRNYTPQIFQQQLRRCFLY